MTIGLKHGTVQVVPYDSSWAIEYESEKYSLVSKLGEEVLAIEHVGSTAIPGVWAKPIIDINIAIESLNKARHLIEPLAELGYEYIDQDFKDRLVFVKGPDRSRTHHLKLVEQSSQTAWLNALLFRDYLIAHPIALEEYTQLKQRLGAKYSDNREAYTEAKKPFIMDIVRKAMLQSSHE